MTLWCAVGFGIGVLWVPLTVMFYVAPPSVVLVDVATILAAISCPPVLFAHVLFAPVLNAVVYALLGLGWTSLESDHAKTFAIASTGTALAVTVLNAWPYLRTRAAPASDGFQVGGFPFTFSRRGGFANVDEFLVVAFLADLAFGLAVSVAAGYAATLAGGRQLRSP